MLANLLVFRSAIGGCWDLKALLPFLQNATYEEIYVLIKSVLYVLAILRYTGAVGKLSIP